MRKCIKFIKRDLAFAAFIMRCLPKVTVQKYRTAWPEIVYSIEEINAQEPLPMPYRPTPSEISRMEKILGWYRCLNTFENKLVWKRSCRVPWKSLCYKLLMHRSTLFARYERALAKIQVFLDQEADVVD